MLGTRVGWLVKFGCSTWFCVFSPKRDLEVSLALDVDSVRLTESKRCWIDGLSTQLGTVN